MQNIIAEQNSLCFTAQVVVSVVLIPPHHIVQAATSRIDRGADQLAIAL